MSYLVKARARLDLKGHWRYIARDNLSAADRLLSAAEETFKLIAESPEIGSQRSFRRMVGIRSRAVTGFRNYLVFYHMRGEKVVIVRVIHGMRDLPRFFFKART
jgi:toxin ParE1/3/4